MTTNDHTLTDKSIAIQKGVAVVNDTGVTGPTPGDTLEYTLSFQVSDFFAFQGVVITDTISDGQHWMPARRPPCRSTATLTPWRRRTLRAANYDVVCNYSPIGGAECETNDPAANNGTTTLYFRVRMSWWHAGSRAS